MKPESQAPETEMPNPARVTVIATAAEHSIGEEVRDRRARCCHVTRRTNTMSMTCSSDAGGMT